MAGFLLALERPEAVGEAFLICGPSYVSQRDLAALVAKHTGGRVLPFRIPARPIQWAGDLVEAICVPLGLEPPLHRRRVDFWTKSRAFTIEKARRLLGYDPQTSLEQGIAAHGGLVPRGRMAVSGRCRVGDRGPASCSRCSAPCSWARRWRSTCRAPRGARPGATAATYHAMAWSLARDGDLRFEERDLARIRLEYPSGPQGVFLKRASGGLTIDAEGGFPWLRRVRPDEGRLYFAKAFAHPLAAAPLVAVFGTRGLTLANGLLLSAVLWLSFAVLRAARARGRPAASRPLSASSCSRSCRSTWSGRRPRSSASRSSRPGSRPGRRACRCSRRCSSASPAT